MNKHSWLIRLAAFMVVLAMILGSVIAGYSEDTEVTEPDNEAAENVTEAETPPEAEPEPEPAPEADPEPDNTVITELEPEEETQVEEIPVEDTGAETGEEESDDFGDDELVEFEDDDAGIVSQDLLEQFNNPELYEQVEFSGSAEIELKETADMWKSGWDGRITLVAKVRDANLSYRLVWEANDHDDRGWFTVGSGSEYSYTLTADNAEREANREYRVVMFTID